MEIRETSKEGVTVVTLVGRLDELATTDVEVAFAALAEAGPERVVVDMEGVEYISSSGLRVLLMLLRAMEKKGGQLTLCSLSPFVAEVFDVSNFARLFDVRPDLRDALRASA